ncbi:DUF547 domain-containing protein [Lacinutrix sp. WUR7]|uniref:DUF547 domain-containing protein n=1 Tax=Lacinutrix sp. WUR7 TaxID=2653681 RepID=UPI001EF04030|nr:DUF547 domain-containing protein [Lacinutrix sp. WUR7]
MKHFSLIFFAILITSCCSAKQVVTDQEIVKVETIVVSETAKQVEMEAEVEEDSDASEEVVEENNKAIIIGENTTIKMPGLIVSINKKDSITSNLHLLNHHRWEWLLGEHVSDNGNVDYLGFKKSKNQLRDYITHLSENLPTEAWTKEDKLAYWINAYNALTVDLIIRNYPIKSIKDIKDPWDQRLWQLGEKWYNLNEIEHEILRKMEEPRIHFAIVCASFSCPKLQNEAFTASKLEAQLTNATKAFLADANRNEIASDKIKISKIFQWFSKDFKQNGSLIDFLNTYSEVKIDSKAKKSYKDYNWELND